METWEKRSDPNIPQFHYSNIPSLPNSTLDSWELSF